MCSTRQRKQRYTWKRVRWDIVVVLNLEQIVPFLGWKCPDCVPLTVLGPMHLRHMEDDVGTTSDIVIKPVIITIAEAVSDIEVGQRPMYIRRHAPSTQDSLASCSLISLSSLSLSACRSRIRVNDSKSTFDDSTGADFVGAGGSMVCGSNVRRCLRKIYRGELTKDSGKLENSDSEAPLGCEVAPETLG